VHGKSKKAKQACKEGHKIGWKEAKDLQIELNTTNRKYKESTEMTLAAQPISKPNLNISPIWTLITAAEFRKLHTTPFSVHYVGKFHFYVSNTQNLSL
jgi:hypothetical protein